MSDETAIQGLDYMLDAQVFYEDRTQRARDELLRLESQNQALQEALRKQADEWNDEMAMLGQGILKDQATIKALQEALREIANNTLLSHKEITDLADAALSPTQETDWSVHNNMSPEEHARKCGCAYKGKPTQETDPE